MNATIPNALGLAKKLISELNDVQFTDDREYSRMSRRVDVAFRGLNSLWSNPADKQFASTLKTALAEAWNIASAR